MAHTNGIITTPVNTDDVSATIGVPSHDVATLCSSPKINKWARFKPLNIDQIEDITEYQRNQINHGITPPQIYTSVSELITALKKGDDSWIYTHPSKNCMKRLTDFAGYNHNAPRPFGTMYGPIKYVLSNSRSLVISALEPTIAADCLSLKDFNNPLLDMSKWYFSVLLYKGDSYWISSAAGNMSSNSGIPWQVDFGTFGSESYKGQYKAIPFLSSHKWVVGAANPSSFQSCGIESRGVDVVMETSTEAYNIVVRCYFPNGAADNILKYEISIHNTTSLPRTFNNLIIQIATSSNGKDAQTVVLFGNITVQPNTTWSNEGEKNIAYSGAASMVFTYFRYSFSGAGTVQWIPMLIPAPQ